MFAKPGGLFGCQWNTSWISTAVGSTPQDCQRGPDIIWRRIYCRLYIRCVVPDCVLPHCYCHIVMMLLFAVYVSKSYRTRPSSIGNNVVEQPVSHHTFLTWIPPKKFIVLGIKLLHTLFILDMNSNPSVEMSVSRGWGLLPSERDFTWICPSSSLVDDAPTVSRA